PDVVPLAFNRRPLDGSLVGEDVEASGYHMIAGEVPHRKFGVLEVTNVLDAAIVANGNGVRGTCQGDSGGPLFFTFPGAAPAIVGTVEGGNVSCTGESYYSRTDVLAGWIDEQLSAFAASPPSPPRPPEPTCASETTTGPWPVALGLLVFPGRRRRT